MNPNYVHTLTVYNCLRKEDSPDEEKDTWHRTILRDCYYKNAIGRVEGDKSIRMSNIYTARIPMSGKYLPYLEWARLPQEERSRFITFSLNDIVVLGECPEEITGAPPYTSTEVLKRYKPDAFIVTAFSDNTTHLCSKHYRVGG